MSEASPIVYVVDDDRSVRRALRRLLCSAGREVETFESADAFLAAELPRRDACLVLDVRMPGTSGLALCERLDVSQGAPPIVLITGHGDEEIRRQGLEHGAVAVLFKPFEDEDLLTAVDRALAVSRSRTDKDPAPERR